MKKFRFLVVAIDEWGGSIKHEVRAMSEQEAEDIFNFMHAAENLEIVEIECLGL
jgi:hypothetical protein